MYSGTRSTWRTPASGPTMLSSVATSCEPTPIRFRARTSTTGCGSLGGQKPQDPPLVGRQLGHDPGVGRMGPVIGADVGGLA